MIDDDFKVGGFARGGFDLDKAFAGRFRDRDITNVGERDLAKPRHQQSASLDDASARDDVDDPSP